MITYTQIGFDPFRIIVKRDHRKIGNIFRITYGPTGERVTRYVFQANNGRRNNDCETLDECKAGIEAAHSC